MSISDIQALPVERPAKVRVADLLALTKPRIVTLALAATVVGFLLGSGPVLDPGLLVASLCGIAAVGAGGNILNMLMEREADGRMERTAGRPLPAGRLSEGDALLAGTLLAAGGWIVLAVFVDHLTALLAAFTLASYVFLYTPLKRETAACTLVGAVPGALPPVLGWTAATGELGSGAVALFVILFFWQLPHFYPLAWMYREDYVRGGFRMLSREDPTGERSALASLVTALALLAVSLLPVALGMAGEVYLLGALVLGLALVILALAFRRRPSRGAARRLFLGTVVYLPILLALLLASPGPALP